MSSDQAYVETRLSSIAEVLVRSEHLLSLALRDLIACRGSCPRDGAEESRLASEVNSLEERIRLHRDEEKELRGRLRLPLSSLSSPKAKSKSPHPKKKKPSSLKVPRDAFASPETPSGEDSKAPDGMKVNDIQKELRNASCLKEDGWKYSGEHVGCGIRRFFGGSYVDGKVVAFLPEERNDGIALWYSQCSLMTVEMLL